MKDYQSGAYFINRRTGRRAARRRSHGRAAGVLIAVLLLLTAGICCLVVFLPKLTASSGVSSPTTFGGKTFYMLATAKTDDRLQAMAFASDAQARGGAGYIYNDGSYHVVASAYERESDVKTLVTLNADSHYFAIAVPAVNASDGDSALLDHITGEWFESVSTAASELDRGNLSDASAEYTVAKSCSELCKMATANPSALANAVVRAAEFSVPQNCTVLAYIRYVQVGVIVAAYEALS